MCERSSNTAITLAYCEGFGSITRCGCGTFSLHVGGVSIRMDQRAFLQTAGMCREALESMTEEVQSFPVPLNPAVLH